MNKDKIILDLCGGTGSWSKPYKEAGYQVLTITLPEFDINNTVIEEDRITFWGPNGNGKNKAPPFVIAKDDIYGILAAPPCTMFSFARTNAKKRRDLREGMETVISCLNVIWACQYELKNQYGQKPTLKFWALENPNGHLKYFLGKPSFQFDPYEFGDIYSKKTHLWGWFNEPVKTHDKVARKLNKKFDYLSMEEIKSISDNIWKNTKTRQELRSITPQGFANAFFKANQ